MICSHPFARAYQQAATQSASPGKLVLMLFDGALRFLDAALTGFAETNFLRQNELIHNNLTKTAAIITELQATLNMEAGGETASNLYRLYDFMQEQLRLANLQKKSEPIQVVQRLLGEVRDAWSLMLSNQHRTVINERLAAVC